MYAAVSKWLVSWHRKRQLIAIVVRHFEAVNARSAIRNMCSLTRDGSDGSVVRVCYGNMRPPSRMWFLVSPDMQTIRELSSDEVERLAEPAWR
jgi:hypothetical protein